MYTINEAASIAIQNESAIYGCRLEFTLRDLTEVTIEEDRIWSGNPQFEDATSDSDEFQIGSAIINSMNVSINNLYGEFSDYDFNGATVSAYIKIKSASGLLDTIKRGMYVVTDSNGYNTSSINLECLDFMSKLEVPYGYVTCTYPATLSTIVDTIRIACGVTLLTQNFYNHDYVVQQRPDDEALTCRQVIAFVAQLACSYARFDEEGRLTFQWYDTTVTNHIFTSVYSSTVGLTDIVITGVNAIEEYEENGQERKAEYLFGNAGYVLEVSDNDLIQQGQAREAAETIGANVVGMTFRTVNIEVPFTPVVEIGDTAIVKDRNNNSIFFIITQMQFNLSGTLKLTCNAAEPERNSSARYSQLTRTLVKAKEITTGQITAYNVAMQTLTELMSEAFGIFKTEEIQQDGSVIYILHNKAELTNSNIQWKMTANGLAVSTDYGQTWNAGFDAQGNAVVNVLNAIGVNADWINAGRLAITDQGGTSLFIADMDTGSVYISGDRVFIGDTSATEAISQLSGALTISLSNEAQGIPVDADGDYANFPDVSTRIRVIYGGTDVTTSCNLLYSQFSITGTLTTVTDTSGTYYLYTPNSITADTGYVTFSASYNDGVNLVQTSKRFNLYKVYAGRDGEAGVGTPARTYYIESDVDILKQGQDNEFVPGTVHFNAYYRDGNEITRHAYTGLFKVEITTDGTTWTTVENPTVNKTATSYTPTDPTIVGIRCTLYSRADTDHVYYVLSAGTNTVALADNSGALLWTSQDDIVVSGGNPLDIQTVPTVRDVSALTQDSVFNALTNNGENQGLYLYNHKVYLNASYLATGILRSNNNATYWNLNTGEMVLSPATSVGSENTLSSLITRISNTEEGLRVEIDDREGGDSTLSTQVEANARAITTKITSAQATSLINQKADSIRLKANKIAWTSTNSSMTESGVLSAKSAVISGTLTAGNNSKIGDLTIANGKLTVPAANISGTLTADKIAANAITTDKIVINGVTSTKLADFAVTNSKIATNSITADKIQAGAITADKISAGAITVGKIADGSITGSKINENAVTASKLASNSVSTDKLTSSAVSAAKIATNAVTSAKLASSAVTTVKIADGAITADKITANAITAEKIQASAVTADKIAAKAITANKLSIDDLSAISANLGTITGGSIDIGSGTFKVNSSGAITARSLYATDYVYVRGDNRSFFEVPSSYGGKFSISNDGITVIRNTSKLELMPSSATLFNGYDYGSATSSWNTQLTVGRLYIRIQPDGGSQHDMQEIDFDAFFPVFRLESHIGNTSKYVQMTPDNFWMTGTKSRVVQTENYDERTLYCYETPSPIFGDIGEGIVNSDGKCYIVIDPIFAETITTNQYQVFLQKYGEGDCYVSERKASYFVVSGTPGLSFGWELKAKQADYDQYRLETTTLPIRENVTQSNVNYGKDAVEYLTQLNDERSNK